MSTLTPGELEVYEACSQAEDGVGLLFEFKYDF